MVFTQSYGSEFVQITITFLKKSYRSEIDIPHCSGRVGCRIMERRAFGSQQCQLGVAQFVPFMPVTFSNLANITLALGGKAWFLFITITIQCYILIKKNNRCNMRGTVLRLLEFSPLESLPVMWTTLNSTGWKEATFTR